MTEPYIMCDRKLQACIAGCMKLLRMYPTNATLNSWFAQLVEEKGKRGGWR